MLVRGAVSFALALAFAGCGARSALEDDEHDGAAGPMPTIEACNGLDDDLDELVDEGFRDELGRYVHDDHCARCDAPCRLRS